VVDFIGGLRKAWKKVFLFQKTKNIFCKEINHLRKSVSKYLISMEKIFSEKG